jgi:hypothetical protein
MRNIFFLVNLKFYWAYCENAVGRYRVATVDHPRPFPTLYSNETSNLTRKPPAGYLKTFIVDQVWNGFKKKKYIYIYQQQTEKVDDLFFLFGSNQKLDLSLNPIKSEIQVPDSLDFDFFPVGAPRNELDPFPPVISNFRPSK